MTVTFSSIPATFTDLVLKMSARNSSASGPDISKIVFNSDTATNYSVVAATGDGTNVSAIIAGSLASMQVRNTNGSTSTTNTFGDAQIYIPSYTSTTSKQISQSNIIEDNGGANAKVAALANLYRGTSAISSMTISSNGGSYAINSSFYLYGIKNS